MRKIIGSAVSQTFKRTPPAAREKEMVAKYGEVVNRTNAGKILGMNASTINKLLDDGILMWACAGTRVDVRSIARFIDTPPAATKEYRRQLNAVKKGTANRWGI